MRTKQLIKEIIEILDDPMMDRARVDFGEGRYSRRDTVCIKKECVEHEYTGRYEFNGYVYETDLDAIYALIDFFLGKNQIQCSVY